MGKRKGSSIRKTRKLMRKDFRQRGKLSLSKYFATFKPGERACIVVDAGYQGARPELRFYGRQGIIKEKQGECYELEFFDGNKKKKIIIHPIHLSRRK